MIGVTFVLASLASMGLPGFSGFIAELQVLVGAWKAFPSLAVMAGLGIVLGVAYMIRTLQQSFFSGQRASDRPPADHHFEPISLAERLGAIILLATTFVIGIYPRLLLDLIVPSLASPLMQKLTQGGAA